MIRGRTWAWAGVAAAALAAAAALRDRRWLRLLRLLRPLRLLRGAWRPGLGSSGSPQVVVSGTVGLDFLAYLDAGYPEPDAKVRATKTLQTGGGNAGNTATALARLGDAVRIASCVGTDGAGLAIREELGADGLDLSQLLVRNGTSPFTYVLVDSEAGSRTCVHTPGSCGEPDDIDVEGVALLHCDCRHMRAQIRAARRMGGQPGVVTIDVEKERPELQELLPLGDYLFTNALYPASVTGEQDILRAQAAMLQRYPRARFVVSTQGARGAVLTRRQVDRCPQAAAPLPVARSSFEVGGCKFDSYRVEPWPIESREIVDTTGAGDAFIGGCLHALVRGRPIEEMLSVGSYVASRKLRGVGARSTLPIARDLQDTMNAWTRRLPLRS